MSPGSFKIQCGMRFFFFFFFFFSNRASVLICVRDKGDKILIVEIVFDRGWAFQKKKKEHIWFFCHHFAKAVQMKKKNIYHNITVGTTTLLTGVCRNPY